jgi:hypothetical protein
MGMLLENDVDVLVGTGVWGVLADEEQKLAGGLTLASKFGLHVVQAKQVLDTRVCSSRRTAERVAYSVELYGLDPTIGNAISVPEELDLDANRVRLHKGKRKPGQYFAEFHFVPKYDDIEQEARLRLETVLGHLIKHHPAFAKATVVQMAWETLPLKHGPSLEPDASYRNYRSLRPTLSPNLTCRDVSNAWDNARELISENALDRTVDPRPTTIVCPAAKIPLSDCQIKTVDDSQSRYALRMLTLPTKRYPFTSLRADVVVAGGGTAGANAAQGSIREGAKTVTVEFLPELGGTSTVGRVVGYYWGYKDTELFRTIEDDFKQQSRLAGRCTKGVARMLHYRKRATEAGAKLLTDSIICGAIIDERRVIGLLVEQDGELLTLMGHVVIDATGDGDVAAFAGADFDVGNRRMQCTQNYSQWDRNPGLTAWQNSDTNRDYDILWSHEMSEWQRGYQLSHQHAHYYDFSPMLTVRESRRVIGDYTITLQDVVHRRVGCLLPHQVSAVVEIPYRALLPHGIDGLLVSAKAISQTHNALQFTRASFDIMTLGHVTGRIAALVAKQGIRPREVDLSDLQSELRDLKVIPKSSTTEPALDPVEESIHALIRGEVDSLLRIMVHPPDAVQGPLRKAFDVAQDGAVALRLAKALAWFQDPLGNGLILDEMQSLFLKEQREAKLPREYYREDKATSYWTINQDIALLGMSGDSAVLDPILELADALTLGNPPVQQKTIYNQGRIDLKLVPFYNRIINVCFTVERMPNAKAIRSLSRFLDDRFIRGHVSKTPEDARSKIYGGILESRLAATLARCGAQRGLMILTDYLGDVHPMLVEYAQQELAEILGKDFDRDPKRWRAHITSLSYPLPTVAYSPGPTPDVPVG